MKIVVLDGYVLNPGDLSWDALKELGEIAIYDRSPKPAQVYERGQGAHAILSNKGVLSREQIERLPDLQYIGVMATGYNNVDVEAAKERGIPVTNVPGYGTASVAQHVFALMLEISNQVGSHARGTSAGEWSNNPDWCYAQRPIIEWADKKMGIIGLGNIGRQVAHIAQAFGMEVLAHGPRPRPTPGVKWVDKSTLLKESDVISLHCPLTEDTFQLINARTLAKMKSSAILINTGRGDLINEHDLLHALKNEDIAGAGLDVLTQEPPPQDHPLLKAPNCWVTPHHAWASRASRQRLLTTVTNNLKAFMNGNPINVVNP